MENGELLQMRGICKYFPGVNALQNVDFTLRSGEIHALMGENGAGKSTLIKVLTGVYVKDGGKIFMRKEPPAGAPNPDDPWFDETHIRSPQDAQNSGISTVYQEIALCPNLSVAENMFLGRSGGITNWAYMNRRTTEILTQLDIPATARQQLGSCSIAVQQMVAIARAVDMKCRVLILDEPTSSLDEQEVEKLSSL
jgi:simple sugar transport system ATP-binding protein